MKISIIGAAGNIGAAAAFNIAIHKITDDLVMVDSFSPDKLAQYVYDLRSAVTGFDVRVRAGEYADMVGSDIVLVAAGSASAGASRLDLLPQNLPLMRDFAEQIKKYCAGSVVVVVSNPVCPLNYALYLMTGFERRQLIGFSANDSVRFCQYLSEELHIPASHIDANVIGEHGESQVPLFSAIYVEGKLYPVPEDVKAKVSALMASSLQRLEELRLKTGRTAAWTTSMGLAAMCRAIAHDTQRAMPCSVVLDGEYGVKRLSMSVPAIIGRAGVLEIQQLILQPEERAALNHSVEVLRPAMKTVEEYVRKNHV